MNSLNEFPNESLKIAVKFREEYLQTMLVQYQENLTIKQLL